MYRNGPAMMLSEHKREWDRLGMVLAAIQSDCWFRRPAAVDRSLLAVVVDDRKELAGGGDVEAWRKNVIHPRLVIGLELQLNSTEIAPFLRGQVQTGNLSVSRQQQPRRRLLRDCGEVEH